MPVAVQRGASGFCQNQVNPQSLVVVKAAV